MLADVLTRANSRMVDIAASRPRGRLPNEIPSTYTISYNGTIFVEVIYTKRLLI